MQQFHLMEDIIGPDFRYTNLVFYDVLYGLEASEFVGQIEGLEHVGERGVPATDPLNGRFEMQKALLLDSSSDFSTEAVCQRSLMGDDHATSFFDRLKENFH